MEAALVDLLAQLSCPLCKLTLHVPFIIPSCAHIFCQSCLMLELKKKSECPTCGEILLIKNLRKCNSVSTMVACVKKMQHLLIDGAFPLSRSAVKTPISAVKALDLNKTTPKTPVIQEPQSRQTTPKTQKRNAKGDHIDSSSKKRKSTDNYSPLLNPKAKAGKYVLLPTGLTVDQKEIIRSSYRQISPTAVSLKSSYSSDVTHIIVGGSSKDNGPLLCPRTVKYLRGILDGKFIVTYEWYLASLSASRLLPEEDYLVRGDDVAGEITDAVKKSIEAHQKDEKSAKLFTGLSFYISGVFSEPAPTRNDLCALIAAGNGKIVNRKPRIGDEKLIIITAHDESSNGWSWMKLFDYISRFRTPLVDIALPLKTSQII